MKKLKINSKNYNIELFQVDPSEYNLCELEKFLSTLSVNPNFKNYKGFEVDLKGELNPTELLEILFWNEKKWIDFPEFASLYLEKYKNKLYLEFSPIIKSLGKDFHKHLQARLYRTQFGFLTEYHAVILLATVFVPQGYLIFRSSTLDRLGVDCIIFDPTFKEKYNIHIFVESKRAKFYREKKRNMKHSNKLSGIHIDFPYTLKQGFKHSLKFLPNNFGVYTNEYAQYLLDLIKSKNFQSNTNI